MEITITKKIEVHHCNDCPFCNRVIDISVVFDSFDNPNYDFYCKHEDANNKGMSGEKYNDEKHGTYIDTVFNSFQKCIIPEWCPFKVIN